MGDDNSYNCFKIKFNVCIFQIDSNTLPLLSEEQLATYLPKLGDRLAAREFCQLKIVEKPKDTKESLFDRLRARMKLRNSGKRDHESDHDSDSDNNNMGTMKKTRNKMSGNKIASKQTRAVKLGWIHQGKPLRLKGGGGSRDINVSKSANKDVLLEIAKNLFFPGGSSKKYSLDEVDCDILDFQEIPMPTSTTVGEVFDMLKVGTARFYLSTTLKTKCDKNSSEEIATTSKNIQEDPSSQTECTTLINFFPESLPNLDTIDLSILTDSCVLGSINDYATPSGSVSQTAEVSESASLSQSSEQPNSAPLSQPLQVSIAVPETSAASYLTPNISTYMELKIYRGPMGFMQLIGYFKDATIMNNVITIVRILPNGEKEVGEDTGGVLRDLLTEFWSDFYSKCTVGREVKVPCLRHDFGLEEWKAVARVLKYGWNNTGYWPVQLAKVFLQTCMFPEMNNNIELLTDFYSFVSLPDKDMFEQGIEDFSSVDTDDIIDTLDVHECRTRVHADNFKVVLLEIAHKELIQMPMFVCDCWREVLIDMQMTPEKLRNIYSALQPSNKNIVQLLKFPEFMDAEQSQVSKHLKRYLKELDARNVKKFLRFCTGSDLITVPQIIVEFVKLAGLQRRPIGHTCGCLLELPQSYENFMEFRNEFDNVLESNVWVMDII